MLLFFNLLSITFFMSDKPDSSKSIDINRCYMLSSHNALW